MLFRNPKRPDRPVRLAACMNLWPVVETGPDTPLEVAGRAGVDAILAGLRQVTVPLRDRLACGSARFGVGLWVPARVARHLALNADERARLFAFLRAERLDAFTFNAFPFGDFHKHGLKAGVFEPDWLDPERTTFTRDVLALGLACAREFGWDPARHVSVSTHTGWHVETLWQRALASGSLDALDSADPASVRAAWLERLRADVARAFVALHHDAELQRASAAAGVHAVLGLEPEPRSLAGDTRELQSLWRQLQHAGVGRDEGAPVAGKTTHMVAPLRARLANGAGEANTASTANGKHKRAGKPSARFAIGTCLDACHAAVEFEAVDDALARVLGIVPAGAEPDPARPRFPLAKLQYSSALRLNQPSVDPQGFATLLAQDEAVYLHQVTGRRGTELLRAGDLGELKADPETWRALDELRCHFHVPVDLASSGGLDTTADYASAMLQALLAAPESWGTAELHVEIETYTWSLNGFEAFERSVVDGIEGEYRQVIGLLESAGWQPVEA